MIDETEMKTKRTCEGLMVVFWGALVTVLTLSTVEFLGSYTPENWMWVWTGSMDCSTQSVEGVCGVFPVGVVGVLLFWTVLSGGAYTAVKNRCDS